jgi:hypothetical protein
VVAPCQGRRGVRAVLRGPSGRRGRVGRHGADVPRGGTVLR